MHDKILILDFGSQVTQLIARRIRESHVYSEIHPYDVDEAFIREFAPKGIILSGGPNSVTEAGSPRAPQIVFDLGVPVLGICYGMQTMADSARRQGRARQAARIRLCGSARAQPHGLPERHRGFPTDDGHGMLKVWMSHGDKVADMPAGFRLMASTPSCPIAAMADDERRFYGLQWHPEVTHTVQGRAMLDRFVLTVVRRDGRLGDGALHRRGRREDSRASRRRARDSGLVGRRGFVGGGSAVASRHW